MSFGNIIWLMKYRNVTLYPNIKKVSSLPKYSKPREVIKISPIAIKIYEILGCVWTKVSFGV